MYVRFPDHSGATRVDSPTIDELQREQLTEDEREAIAEGDREPPTGIERDDPDDDTAIQVPQAIGDHLVEEHGFVEGAASSSSGSGSDTEDDSEVSE